MITFLEFLQRRLAADGFATEDALASILPLMRQVAAAHRAGQVGPLEGTNSLFVEGVAIWYEERLNQPPKMQPDKIHALDQPPRLGLEVVGTARMTTDDTTNVVSLDIAQRGDEITRPVYLPGYVSWEHEVGHHDPLTDIFSLGILLASLTCGLDFTQPDDLAAFVRHRRNLFDLNPNLHPVLAKAVVRMTELSRHRRPQDLAALLHTLENYRDQAVDFDFDLARLKDLKTADRKGKRALILGRLQQRLFEISRRNRLLHFRQTMQTVNLTWASVPLSFDVNSVRPEQILTWNADFQATVVAGKPISLNKYLRFEEAAYLPHVLDEIRNEARRDQAEFGFAQLRLVLCFLRWSNLKEKPPERFDSPLVLLPVHLTKTKGVRDVFHLEPLSTEAEVNPILRHVLKQVYNVELPERIDLATTALDTLYDFLVGKIQTSEPAVSIAKIDRPQIQLLHASASRRREQYQRRSRLSGRGVRTFQNLDYSYDRDNFHPLGLRIFQTRIKPTEMTLRTIVDETPRPRTFMAPPTEPAEPDKERLLYAKTDEETNPYRWEFDLCNVTLGNFRYRKMSLVRDYGELLEKDGPHTGFDAIFSLEPRAAEAARPGPPAIEDSYPVVSCDPTQSSAIALARTGQNYIIQGPPGTGKSQTITNLIADYVMRGKRVLFVCEKRAAIDVVYHRLKQSGLHHLCCLIHDSQADKKEFVMDLKQTYESFLETKEQKENKADAKRRKLLDAVAKELTPLSRFDDAMRKTPPESGIPLRRLLHRGVELPDALPELSALEQERLPAYALWEENRERLTRLADLLKGSVGHTMFAQHPLRLLSCRLVGEDRPLEFINKRLASLQALLTTLENQLRPLSLNKDDWNSPRKLETLVEFADKVQFLAERDQLSILAPKTELSKKLTSHQQKIQKKTKELEQAQTATKNWRTKLAADETKVALEQATRFEQSFFSFLKPGWWRLRGTMRRCFDFKAYSVKPSWSQVLQGLSKEHDVGRAVAELEADACAEFACTDAFADFQRRVNDTKEKVGQADAIQRRILDSKEAAQTILEIAKVKPLVAQMSAELADFLEVTKDITLADLRAELERIAKSLDTFPDFLPCLTELAALPPKLADALRLLSLKVSQLESATIRRTLEDLYRNDRDLARFTGQVRDKHVARLEEVHDQLYAANAATVEESIRQSFLEHVKTSSLPHGQLTAGQKEFKVEYNRGRRELEHEFGKTMRYKSIRELVAGDSGRVMKDLKPVWLMSPLSVSDTLPLDAELFDVVIFDEASQVTLEEAVPGVFRAKQVIVVGDEMQLPPTSFFASKMEDDGERFEIEHESGERVEYDMSSNSFLNHAARNFPATMLGWHYRSRSESLISFSNAAFYQGRLLTVPEVKLAGGRLAEIRVQASGDGGANVARLLERPLSFHLLEKGVYQQRRNAMEADYIAELVRGLLTEETGLSIGIIAFSEAQQDAIEKALQNLASDDSDFQARLETELEREHDGQFVGLLVKNLENIQGDERDVVILSVCYGPGPNGKMLMNFGPINQAGGERRLNVAFSRAKQHMVLVSSIRHHAITNDYNDGARCLKNYLRYAESMSKGDTAAACRVLNETTLNQKRETAEETADAVIAALTAALKSSGYEVDHGTGQSHFRCDLAVRKPNDLAYRLGIFVDTDAYYQQPNILERDILRPKLLRAFGWQVVHVLTKEWQENPRAVLEKLEGCLGHMDQSPASRGS